MIAFRTIFASSKVFSYKYFSSMSPSFIENNFTFKNLWVRALRGSVNSFSLPQRKSSLISNNAVNPSLSKSKSLNKILLSLHSEYHILLKLIPLSLIPNLQ